MMTDVIQEFCCIISKAEKQVNSVVIWLTVNGVPQGHGLTRAQDGLGWS